MARRLSGRECPGGACEWGSRRPGPEGDWVLDEVVGEEVAALRCCARWGDAGAGRLAGDDGEHSSSADAVGGALTKRRGRAVATRVEGTRARARLPAAQQVRRSGRALWRDLATAATLHCPALLPG